MSVLLSQQSSKSGYFLCVKTGLEYRGGSFTVRVELDDQTVLTDLPDVFLHDNKQICNSEFLVEFNIFFS